MEVVNNNEVDKQLEMELQHQLLQENSEVELSESQKSSFAEEDSKTCIHKPETVSMNMSAPTPAGATAERLSPTPTNRGSGAINNSSNNNTSSVSKSRYALRARQKARDYRDYPYSDSTSEDSAAPGSPIRLRVSPSRGSRSSRVSSSGRITKPRTPSETARVEIPILDEEQEQPPKKQVSLLRRGLQSSRSGADSMTGKKQQRKDRAIENKNMRKEKDGSAAGVQQAAGRGISEDSQRTSDSAKTNQVGNLVKVKPVPMTPASPSRYGVPKEIEDLRKGNNSIGFGRRLGNLWTSLTQPGSNHGISHRRDAMSKSVSPTKRSEKRNTHQHVAQDLSEKQGSMEIKATAAKTGHSPYSMGNNVSKSDSTEKQHSSILRSQDKSPARRHPRKAFSSMSLATTSRHKSKSPASPKEPKTKASLQFTPQAFGEAAAAKKNLDSCTDDFASCVKRERELLEELEMLQQKKAKLNRQPTHETSVSVVAPQPSQSLGNAARRDGNQSLLPSRPLPALPSEKAASHSQDRPPTTGQNLTKKLPAPPRNSSLGVRRPASSPQPNQPLRHTATNTSSHENHDSRKRKAGASVSYVDLRAVSRNSPHCYYYSNEEKEDSEYLDDRSASEDFEETSPVRSQPGRQAKLRKTSRHISKQTLAGPRHRRRPSISSSVSPREKNIEDGSPESGKLFTATPGVDGVPLMPGAGRTRKDDTIIEEENEEDSEPDHSGFKWPDECF